MINRSLGELDTFEKAYVFWFGGGYVLLLILGLIGHWPPFS